jgi:hypothetical protein
MTNSASNTNNTPAGTKGLFFASGNVGGYQNQQAVFNKFEWNGTAFVLAVQLKPNSGLPDVGLDPALYCFTYLNKAANAPQFRSAMSAYSYAAPGQPGTSKFWIYEAASAGLTLKTPQAGISFNPPFNPRNLANVDFVETDENNDETVTHLLVYADYDSLNNIGGTIGLLGMDASDNYTSVFSQDIPSGVAGYQQHAQDVFVKGNRIFTLFIVSDSTAMTYQNSQIREYKVERIGGNIQLTQVGNTVTLSANAQKLVYWQQGANEYLFVPCIGGMQHIDGTDNGANSSLSMVDITSGLGSEQKSYVGKANDSDFYDFRDITIASDGSAYILTGDYNASAEMYWKLYMTTASALITLANTGSPGNISNRLLVKDDHHANAYFWAIGICKAGTDEYLIFGKGSAIGTTAYSMDEVHVLRVGGSWSDTADADNAIFSPAALGGETSFAINCIAISVPGGEISLLRSAGPPAGPGGASLGLHLLPKQLKPGEDDK